MPKVSVIMPAYNVAEFITEAIDSVLAQSFRDFELIIVNDGSTDETVGICQSYSDSRIRRIDQQNRGLSGARNTGISAARGNYIALLDADDAWHPAKLEMHIAHLDANPEIGVSYSASRFMDHDGSILGIEQSPKLRNIKAHDVLCRNPIGNGSAPVFRRSVFEDIEVKDDRYGSPEPVYFDPDFRQSEDIECWTRIATTTRWRFEGLSTPLTLYRLNSGGLSASVDRQLASWEMFITKAETYAPELVEKYGKRARAYQYRYLSRRAIWSREMGTARRLFIGALKSDWKIALLEPRRAMMTAAALLLGTLVPESIFSLLEKGVLAARKRTSA